MKTKNQTQNQEIFATGSLVLPEHWFDGAQAAMKRFGVWARNHFLPTHANGFFPHFHRSRHLSLYVGMIIVLKLAEIGTLISHPVQDAVAAGSLGDQRGQVISETNSIRTTQGLNTLSLNTALNSSAQAKAEDMANKQYFGHAGPDGNRLAYWLSTVGYSYSLAGENLAMGFSSGTAAMQGWINSPTHYANIVESKYTEFGVGIASGTYEGEPTVFIVQHFGTPKTVVQPVAPQPVVTEPVVTEPVAQPVETTQPAPIFSVPTAVASPEELEALISNNPSQVESTPEVKPVRTAINYDASQSRVGWDEQGDEVSIQAVAMITGPVASATVSVGSLTIDLAYRSELDRYIGFITMPNTSAEVSSALTVPTIQIKSKSGQILTDSIDWAGVKTLAQMPTSEYLTKASEVTQDWLWLRILRAMTLGGLAALAMTLAVQAYFAIRQRKPILGAEMTATAVVILTLVIL